MRKTKASNFLFGLTLAGACLVFALNKMDVLRWLTGENVTYNNNTLLFNSYEYFFTWAPWVVFLLLLFLKRRRPSSIHPAYYFLGAALPVSVIVFMLLFGSTVENYYYREDFDSAVWRSTVDDNVMWPTKLRMVDDLISSGKLDKLTINEVTDLLGEPSMTDGTSADNPTIIYHLGPERGFMRIDSEWLSIEFNERGIVNKYWTWTD